jgi:hypothetical protein
MKVPVVLLCMPFCVALYSIDTSLQFRVLNTFLFCLFRMKYYSGCSATINRANGTIESPAYGVTGYPPNQVTEQ